MFVATHGWWPWLLTLLVLILVVGGAGYYFVRRRGARPRRNSRQFALPFLRRAGLGGCSGHL